METQRLNPTEDVITTQEISTERAALPVENPGAVLLLAESDLVPKDFRETLDAVQKSLTGFQESTHRTVESLQSDCLLLGTLDQQVSRLQLLAEQLISEKHELSFLIANVTKAIEVAADRTAANLLATFRSYHGSARA